MTNRNNKHYNNYSYNRNYVKDDSNKVVAIVALILVVLMAVYFALAAIYKTYNPLKWWGNANDETGTTISDYGGVTVAETTTNGIELTSSTISSLDYAVYGISTNAEKAELLTATAKSLSEAQIDWSIAWVNADSDWAKGRTVTDYMTVTPTADGATTAAVACLNAFGEQIIVTASVRDVANINAQITYDYERRICGVDFSMSSIMAADDEYVNAQWDLSFTNASVTVDFPEFSEAVLNNADLFKTIGGNNNGDGGYLAEASVNIEPCSFAYTIDNLGEITTKAYVAYSSEYMSCLSTAGLLNDTATAETYYELDHISFADIVYNVNFRNTNLPTADSWNQLVNAMTNTSSGRHQSLLASTLTFKVGTSTDTPVIHVAFEVYSDDVLVAETVYALYLDASDLVTVSGGSDSVF